MVLVVSLYLLRYTFRFNYCLLVLYILRVLDILKVGLESGGGSKYHNHYKMTHFDCRIQDSFLHVLFVYLSCLFISVAIQLYVNALNT